jgi:mRNA-degrading endonuclease RelE of RelBE toxin-antitoxin system
MYEVVWDNEAENELLRLWLQARDRAYVRETVDAFDERLAQYPYLFGESREENSRVAFVGDFVFSYRIDPQSRVVTVQTISRLQRGL